MWNLNLDKISALVPGGLGSLAIESGTCRGNGARALRKRFDRVITVELSNELHELASKRLEAEGLKVETFLGNSSEVFAKILPDLPTQRIFFFLDAHWSGDESVDWASSSWKGYGLNTAHLGKGVPTPAEQCPLAEELRVIMERCAGPAVVLIDDMKNIPAEGEGLKNNGFAGEDWSHLSRSLLRNIVASRLEMIHELQFPDQWLLVLRPIV